MNKILKKLRDFKLLLKRLFTRPNFTKIRKYTQASNKKYLCERVLNDRTVVADFGLFYRTHKENLDTVLFYLNYTYRGTADNLVSFLASCDQESKIYQREVPNKKKSIL